MRAVNGKLIIQLEWPYVIDGLINIVTEKRRVEAENTILGM